MESADIPTTWKVFQGKLRENGANTVYAAREMLAKEYVLQQRKRDPLGFDSSVETLSAHPCSLANISSYSLSQSPPSDFLLPRATSLPCSLANISSYSLSQSPPSDFLPSQQRRRSLSFFQGMHWDNDKKQHPHQRVTSGFKSFVDEVVGRGEPESQYPVEVSRGLTRCSSFDGVIFSSVSRMTRRLSLGGSALHCTVHPLVTVYSILYY